MKKHLKELLSVMLFIFHISIVLSVVIPLVIIGVKYIDWLIKIIIS